MKQLNLHKIKHEDVRNTVIRFVEDSYNSGKRAVIITGHSKSMKDLVIEVLKEYDLKYRIGDRFQLNTGIISIDDM